MPLVRAFAWLSALVVAIISAIGLIDVVVHFTLKDEIINTCTTLSEGGRVYYVSPCSIFQIERQNLTPILGRYLRSYQ